ncbi:MAG: 50S ribosomal protein L9 [Candidatus Taylorbacteria bacterium RIFCSPHIGHO2_02_FULL_46_13]|uniref:Large ribosomal subunit protein bL9 n=1 Tax=Candidatus Taylorbacteria bacterium RIFCSPHIGHO2_02_FULL_46_13 TaxID=1802312 RepID=A0A1G2MU66_9BACT|nr:MAG: 50S ribosomal protein L9 [Candidatus Taylorbacteria bacterium RIFCSPHIGHO2_02_FULL_46_13]
MKIILTQDVKGLGKRFDVKNVSDGYAINMLIPRKMVREATAGALKQVETQKARQEADRKIQENILLKNISDLEGKVIHISAKASDKGHLFASIHKEDIVHRLKEELRLDVHPDFLELPEHIKTVGEHALTVSLQDKKVKFTLSVEAEK